MRSASTPLWLAHVRTSNIHISETAVAPSILYKTGIEIYSQRRGALKVHRRHEGGVRLVTFFMQRQGVFSWHDHREVFITIPVADEAATPLFVFTVEIVQCIISWVYEEGKRRLSASEALTSPEAIRAADCLPLSPILQYKYRNRQAAFKKIHHLQARYISSLKLESPALRIDHPHSQDSRPVTHRNEAHLRSLSGSRRCSLLREHASRRAARD